MVSQLGAAALWMAVVLALWCVVASVAGSRPGLGALAASGARALPVIAVLTAGAFTILVQAFAARDFSFRLVAELTTHNLPPPYAVAASWNTPAGAAIVGAMAIACAGMLAQARLRTRSALAAATATASLGGVLAALILVTLAASPFERLQWLPAEGRGLALNLQFPATALAPLAVACGTALAVAGHAVAIAAVVRHRDVAEWRGELRAWFVGAWLAFTIAAYLGLWGAVREQHDLARWMGDPVRSGTIFPWLAITALVHTLRLGDQLEEKQKATAPDDMATRVSESQSPPALRSPSPRSLSVAILLASLASASSLLALWRVRGGVFSGVSGTVMIVTCVALVVLSLLALRSSPRASVTRPGQTLLSRPNGESRPLVRVGAHLTHAGAIAICVALLGTMWHRETRATLAPGAAVEIRDPLGRTWRFAHQGVSRYADGVSDVTAIALQAERGGVVRGLITSTRREPLDSRGEPLEGNGAIVGRIGGLESDVRIALERVRADDSADLLVRFEPLAWWIWIGGVSLVAGGVLTLWPATTGGATRPLRDVPPRASQSNESRERVA